MADVSKMGRWSPVCTGGSYDADGEWFTGTNAMGDNDVGTRCRVVAPTAGVSSVRQPRLEGRVEMVRWGFRFRPLAGEAPRSPRPGRSSPPTPRASGSTKPERLGVIEMMRDRRIAGMPRRSPALKADVERER